MKFQTVAVALALTAMPNVSLAAPRSQMLQRQALAFERSNEFNLEVHDNSFDRRQLEKYKPEMDKKKYDEFTRDYGVGGWCRDYKHGQGSEAVEGWQMCVDYCKRTVKNPELVNGQRPNPNCGMAFIPSEQVEAYEREIKEYVDHQGYKWRQLPCDCDMADVAKVVTTFADLILPALGQGLCFLMEELYEGTMKALDIGLTVVDIASTFIPGPGTLVKIGSKALQIGVKAAKTLDKAASAGDKASSALEFANWFGGGCGAEAHKPSMQDIQDKFFPALLQVPDELAAPCVKGKCRDSDKDGNPDFPEGTPEHLPNPPDKAKQSSKPADKPSTTKGPSTTQKPTSATTPKTTSKAVSTSVKPSSSIVASTTTLKTTNKSVSTSVHYSSSRTANTTMQRTASRAVNISTKISSSMTMSQTSSGIGNSTAIPSITKWTSSTASAEPTSYSTTSTSAVEEEEDQGLDVQQVLDGEQFVEGGEEEIVDEEPVDEEPADEEGDDGLVDEEGNEDESEAFAYEEASSTIPTPTSIRATTLMPSTRNSTSFTTATPTIRPLLR